MEFKFQKVDRSVDRFIVSIDCPNKEGLLNKPGGLETKLDNFVSFSCVWS